MSLEHLGAGDSVFVVPQQSRWAKENGVEPVGEWKTISKVGRKYAYIKKHHSGDDEPFYRETGESAHVPNHNQRTNGQGFDVYESPEAYEKTKQEQDGRLKLSRRWSWSTIGKLSYAQIETINAILDEAGHD